MKTFWKQIVRFPPILCRLLARKRKGRPLTTDELAAAAKLPPVTIEALSQQIDWTGVDARTMQSFMVACGADVCNPKHMARVEDYTRKGARFSYLRRSKQWESYYEPMMRKWMGSVKRHA